MTTHNWPFINQDDVLDDQRVSRDLTNAFVERELDSDGNVLGGSVELYVLGQIVREARLRRSLSRSELSEASGLNPAFLALLESGDFCCNPQCDSLDADL